MKKKGIWKAAGAVFLMTAATGCLPVYGAGTELPLTEYDESQLEKFRDDTLEYWEIPGLVEQYNTEFRNQLEIYYNNPGSSTGLTKDQLLSLASDLRQEANELDQEAEDSKDDLTREEYQEYQQNIRALKSYAKDLEDDADGKNASGSSSIRNLRILKNQQIQSAQEKMRAYERLKDQDAIAQKNLETAQLTYESAKLRQELGTYSAENVLDAERALNQARASASAASDALENGKNDLIMMLGWSYGAQPEIVSVPEPDTGRIDGYDLDADQAKAIENNYTLFDTRMASSSSQGGANQKARTIKTQEEQVTMKMDLLYQEVLQKQTAYQAAETAYEKAVSDKTAADSQYSLGMMSRESYLTAEASWLQSEASYTSAKLDLTEAMENYEWAREGLLDIGSGSQ